MTSKRDLFNRYAAHALSVLDKEHPDPLNLVPSKIVSALGHEPTKENVFTCQRTLSWLEDNGYIKCEARSWSGNPNLAETAFPGSRLTTQGFAALDIKIDFRGKLERAGDLLADQVSNVAGKARDAAISEVISRIIGASAKALLGA
jgi:hypothetical protein